MKLNILSILAVANARRTLADYEAAFQDLGIMRGPGTLKQ